MQTQRIQLNDKTAIPRIGLGTWQLTGDEGQASIEKALDIGYRHIDTAYHYHNHQAVGKAVSGSDVDREDIFITTKIWRDHLTEPKLKEQFRESLDQLEMEYVDLLLIHWPNEAVPIKETLKAMQELRQAERVMAIGVSNFTTNLLREAMETGIKPVVNQVEYHPTLVQTELKNFCDSKDITLTAYSPLGHNGRDLELEPVVEIANKKGVSPATVIIRWLIQQGIVAIPKAASRKHQKQNLHAYQIELTDDQMARISDCDENHRIISPDYGPFAAESKR
jgi:diketogulonate reductase-like aldo/keto reductase